MRNYKFRGKRLNNGEWNYGDLIQSHGYVHVGKENMFLNECKVDPTTVGQYTGLRDKSDVEIYEGDIVTVKDYFCTRQFEGVVEFDNGSFLINQDDWEKNYRWQDYDC